MKQVLQNMKSGALEVTDVPPPIIQRGRVLVRTAASLISAGTEKMTVDVGRKSLLGKARERPDLVKQVIAKARNEGVMQTFNTVRSKLSSSTALGYSAAGTVVEVGEDVTEFRVGDRVACAGAGFASHAEMLSVPKNLCVRVPDDVTFDHAAFGTLGAIALQGIRLAAPTLGESIVVIGLGLLGQLTVQLLKANGCRVFGVDLDESKIRLAEEFGADGGCQPTGAARKQILDWTRGRGADAVLITAATPSNEPVELAGEVSRMKGRVVAVGLVGLDVPRKTFYERELDLKISMSYGPGRYDPEYEERGQDYPFAYVRWTEGRNIEAFIDLIADGRINVERLITHRFQIDDGERAYDLITGATKEPYLGIVLQYDQTREIASRVVRQNANGKAKQQSSGVVRLGMIGAGNYAKAWLLPNFQANRAEFHSIATASGVSAHDTSEKYDFKSAVASADEVINDVAVNLIVIATRHDSHASLAAKALRAGRHVFVEKPLALNEAELADVIDAASDTHAALMVGFNRRFAPLTVQAKEFFKSRTAPLSILYRVNAGRIPSSSWIQDEREGGGRIIGEVCHFVDTMQYLTDSLPVRVYAEAVRSRNEEVTDEDSVFVTIQFADGSNGCIAYLAEGDRALAKERIEIFGEGKTLVLDDFRAAQQFSNGRDEKIKSRGQDKGQAAEVSAVCDVVTKNAPAPISLESLIATTRATFCICESLRTGASVKIAFEG